MTITHTQPAGCDLDSLEALARAATSGPWMSYQTYACNGEAAGKDVTTDDGTPLITEEQHPCDADADFIAAANPATVLALIAAARAAQAPQGDTRQGAPSDRQNMTHAEMLALCKANPALAPGLPLAAHTYTPADERATLLDKLARVARWIDKLPVPTDGATAMMLYLRDVSVAIGEGDLHARAAQGAGTAPADGISPIYAWLERSARSGIAEVDDAARTMMAYFQGAEFPAPVSTAAAPELDALGHNANLVRKGMKATIEKHAAATTASASEDTPELRALKFIERLDGKLEGAGFTLEQRRTVVDLLWNNRAPSRAADGQQGAPCGACTGTKWLGGKPCYMCEGTGQQGASRAALSGALAALEDLAMVAEIDKSKEWADERANIILAALARNLPAQGALQPKLMRQAVASVVSRSGNDLRIGWLRPERCAVGTLLYCAVEPLPDQGAAQVEVEAARDAMTPAARDVLAERQRQVSVEGWTTERDDTYAPGALAAAASCYAIHAFDEPNDCLPPAWPWAAEWWKPTSARRNLVKAAALTIAEIERLDRAALAAKRGGAK